MEFMEKLKNIPLPKDPSECLETIKKAVPQKLFKTVFPKDGKKMLKQIKQVIYVTEGCMWRQTNACKPDGPREAKLDKNCHKKISKGSSGFCDCNGDDKFDPKIDKGYGCDEVARKCSKFCVSKSKPSLLDMADFESALDDEDSEDDEDSGDDDDSAEKPKTEEKKNEEKPKEEKKNEEKPKEEKPKEEKPKEEKKEEKPKEEKKNEEKLKEEKKKEEKPKEEKKEKKQEFLKIGSVKDLEIKELVLRKLEPPEGKDIMDRLKKLPLPFDVDAIEAEINKIIPQDIQNTVKEGISDILDFFR